MITYYTKRKTFTVLAINVTKARYKITEIILKQYCYTSFIISKPSSVCFPELQFINKTQEAKCRAFLFDDQLTDMRE